MENPVTNIIQTPMVPRLVVGTYEGITPSIDATRNVFTYTAPSIEAATDLANSLAWDLRANGYFVMMPSHLEIRAMRTPHCVIILKHLFEVPAFEDLVSRMCEFIMPLRGCVVVVEKD